MIQLREVIKKYSIPLFFLLTFGWSWGCWLSMPNILDTYWNVLQGAESILFVSTIPIHIRIGFALATLTATFGPAISAVILTAAIDGKAGLREFFGRIVNWRVGLRYYLAVFLIPP